MAAPPAMAAPSVSPLARATVASAASACAPHGACPGRSGSASFTCAADRSTTSTSAGSAPPVRASCASRRAASSARRASASQRADASPPSVAIATAFSRWLRMPSTSPAPARTIPCHVSSWMERLRDGAVAIADAALPSHRSAASTSPSSRQAHRHTARGQELGRPVALQPAPPDGRPRRGTGPGPARPWRGSTRAPRTASGGRGGPARFRSRARTVDSSPAGSPRDAGPTPSGA